MFQRLSNGWQLTQQSWTILRGDVKLLLFPLVSGIACLVVLASFAIPLIGSGYAGQLFEADGAEVDRRAQVIGYVGLFAFYFVNYLVIVFFNSALVACAIIRFKGGEPTLGDGFATAVSCLPQIFGWAFTAATVGVLLKVIESVSDRLGQVVTSLLGIGWSMVTYFIVPVIVVERLGPVAAIGRSGAVLKRTWGESFAANFGVGLITFLASLVAIIPVVVGVFALTSGQAILGGIAIALGVCGLLAVSLISSALKAILVAALYLYAAEGSVPGQFDERIFRDAFVGK
ncbi:MAG: hypothetical protein EA381_18190 [Planctomycetaceae bacterium]|nr:MAG: hypothetical protein EA381_18190 [Planctomycetaceae bacterium]